jgi:hypothetical protein
MASRGRGAMRADRSSGVSALGPVEIVPLFERSVEKAGEVHRVSEYPTQLARHLLRHGLLELQPFGIRPM